MFPSTAQHHMPLSRAPSPARCARSPRRLRSRPSSHRDLGPTHLAAPPRLIFPNRSLCFVRTQNCSPSSPLARLAVAHPRSRRPLAEPPLPARVTALPSAPILVGVQARLAGVVVRHRGELASILPSPPFPFSFFPGVAGARHGSAACTVWPAWPARLTVRLARPARPVVLLALGVRLVGSSAQSVRHAWLLSLTASDHPCVCDACLVRAPPPMSLSFITVRPW